MKYSKLKYSMNKKEYINLWVKKADGDLKVAKRELQTQDQQAVEKYLKSFLSIFLKKIEKTHNLAFLIEQCIQIDKDFIKYEEKFDQIAECGVEIRYPDTFLTFEHDELFDMMGIIEEFRKFILKKIDCAINL